MLLRRCFIKSQYPACEKAEEYIRQHYGNSAPGTRLPSTRRLPAQAGVSRGSMLTALRSLEKKGVLHTVEGSGIFWGKQNAGTTAAAPRKRQWEKTCEQLYRDILDNTYPGGTVLPSMKELGEHYGVCFTTLTQACRTLVHKGVLSRHKRSLVVSPLPTHPSSASLEVFLPMHYQRPRGNLPRLRAFLGEIENACTEANMQLHLFGYESGKYQQCSQHIGAERVLGYILWLDDMFNSSSTAAAQAQDLISRLAYTGVPAALFSETGFGSFPHRLLRHRLIQAFTICGKNAGAEIGRILLRLGHTRIAYLSANPGHGWSQDRLEGLRSSLREAGIPDSYLEVKQTLSRHSNVLPVALSLCDMPRDTVALFHRFLMPDISFEDFINRIAGFSRKFPPETVAATLRERISLRCRLMERFLRGLDDLELAVPPGILTAFTVYINDETRWVLLRPLFKEALKEKEVTVWVFDTDETARSACSYLAEQHIPVPGELSLVGFDNIEAAQNIRLSTYDFRIPHIARLAVSFVLNPRAERWHKMPDIEEVPGMLIMRDTVIKRM